jgi:predicted enzyme related to lactoylglutathione lyase
MLKNNRRSMLRNGLALVALPSAILHWGFGQIQDSSSPKSVGSSDDQVKVKERPKVSGPVTKENAIQIQFLEIVTTEVDAVCATYSKLHGVKFGKGDQNLGGARTAKLTNGGMIGVRAPLRDTEKPVVRPYVLVKDIQATVDKAAASGAKVAVPPMKIEGGHGTFAIFIQGGIESGLWQL